MKRLVKNISKGIALLLLVYYTFLLGKISVEYFTFDTDVGFLRIKQDYIGIVTWEIAFYIHVFTSIFCVLAGFTQFSKTILNKYPKLHRVLGYVYVADVLLLSAPSGLIMAFYANGGIVSNTAFILLSILWWWFTFKALQAAKRGQIAAHKNFMIRSYALTLSAITLRLWKIFFLSNWELPPMDVYRVISWLGFGLNWLIAELIIKLQNKSLK